MHPNTTAPRRLALALALACIAAAAQAQTAAPTPMPTPGPELQLQLQLAQAEVERQVFIGEGGDFFGGFDMGPERVVKGAPYCAEAVHETVQWLVDGSGGAPNRITRQTSTRLCRDGEGRTRQELERGGRKLVVLRDPVTRESWVLDPERKTARRQGDSRGGFDAAQWRDYSERMREWARTVADRARAGAPGATPPTPPTPPVPPVPAMAPMPPMPVVIAPAGAAGSAPRPSEVRVLHLRRGGDAPVPAEGALPPPAVQWRAQVLAPRGAGTVTPLPGKDIEGVRANGERTTWVVEAGKVGNEKPFQVTREVWTAPELMVTVMTRDFDPRSGEVNYRLKNLRRGEPDAALMRVPADFSKPARPSPRASAPLAG